jgi:hypothetical protein
LDSIETVIVRACMVKWGLEYPQEVPLPETIEAWVQWAVLSSKTS